MQKLITNKLLKGIWLPFGPHIFCVLGYISYLQISMKIENNICHLTCFELLHTILSQIVYLL